MPDRMRSGATGGEFQNANPRGEVPALIDGEMAIFDSTIILEHIQDKWPPPSSMPRASVRKSARPVADSGRPEPPRQPARQY